MMGRKDMERQILSCAAAQQHVILCWFCRLLECMHLHKPLP